MVGFKREDEECAIAPGESGAGEIISTPMPGLMAVRRQALLPFRRLIEAFAAAMRRVVARRARPECPLDDRQG